MNQVQPYYLLQRAENGQFYFELKAENHETILTSETYASHASAMAGIECCRTNAPLSAHYLRRSTLTQRGQRWYFILRACNCDTIGTSQFYPWNQTMERWISSCCRCGGNAVVVDCSLRVA